jgi:hypothetical protein
MVCDRGQVADDGEAIVITQPVAADRQLQIEERVSTTTQVAMLQHMICNHANPLVGARYMN